MAPTAKRFVILHHTGFGREHWDFMLEQDESLATWKLYHDPHDCGKKGLELFRIEDHRLKYLKYEGPLSAGRGQVRRVCRGLFDLLEKNSQFWQIRLSSGPLVGLLEIRLVEGGHWQLKRVAD